MLYGVVPLVVVGAIVAAFVLVSSGHSTAATSFKTGKAPAAQSATVIDPPTSASPSASATKHHPSAKASPSAVVKVSAPVAEPKPKRKKSSGTASAPVPRDLGQPNFDGYCEHIGSGAAEVTADNAYGWHCVRNSSQVLALSAVCGYTYHLSSSQVIGVSTDYYDADDWQCWQATEDLGVVNFTTYCTGAGLGTSDLVADDAYGWYCTSPSDPVNTTAACQAIYHVSSVVARFALFSDPYSWQCWV